MDYSTLTKAELQEAIDQRNANRPDEERIPRTGTNPELIERLQLDDAERLQLDDDDLLGDEKPESVPEPAEQEAEPEKAPEPDPAPAAPDQLPDVTVVQQQTGTAPQGEVSPQRKHYEARFEFAGNELGTGLHLEFLTRAVDEARAAGLPVKGSGGPSLVRVDQEGNKRIAVYHVVLRKGY